MAAMFSSGNVLYVQCMGITVTRQDSDFETAQCLYRDCPGCSEKQTGVNMLYNSQMFKGVPSVSLDVKNERWDTTLKLVLNPQGFDYVMKDGIVVIRKQKRENRVRGMVTDSHGEPIPGASIIVKGTRTGTSTNIEGEFTLDVKSDKVVLEVSFIGMKKQTVKWMLLVGKRLKLHWWMMSKHWKMWL